MYIYWLGESSFKIKTDDAVIIIDPVAKDTGLSQATIQADILLISRENGVDKTRVQKMQKDAHLFIIQQPGEYETRGIFVYGIPGHNNCVLYLIRVNDVQIAHFSGLTGALNDKQLELFEGADIALLPVGNKDILSCKQADNVINQIEPKVVIPMNYSIPKLAIERDSVDLFLSEMGEKEIKPVTSFYITKEKLPQEETKIVVLEPSKA